MHPTGQSGCELFHTRESFVDPHPSPGAALEQHLGTGGLLCLIAALPILGLLGMAIGSGGVGLLFGIALDHCGMTATLLGLAAVFTPLMAAALVPLVLRIRREPAAPDRVRTAPA